MSDAVKPPPATINPCSSVALKLDGGRFDLLVDGKPLGAKLVQKVTIAATAESLLPVVTVEFVAGVVTADFDRATVCLVETPPRPAADGAPRQFP